MESAIAIVKDFRIFKGAFPITLKKVFFIFYFWESKKSLIIDISAINH